MDLGWRQNLAMTVAATPTLVPYLPRIVLEWARSDPEARWSELEQYQRLIAGWNRFARHRERLRHRAQGESEFLAFLGMPG